MSESKPKPRKGITKKEDFTSSSSSTCSWSSGDERDPLVLKPVKDYLSDRDELAHQLFRSVKKEKIRMMLPQILKNVDMADLEELCASELCGMSKSRILSIINGTPMNDSSDTSENDDSGPSLEIISDTEAWISEGDQQNYISSSNRINSKSSKKPKLNMSRNGCSVAITKFHDRTRMCNRNDNATIKVKKEKEKEIVKNQGGESLLDLLELEMRARAIKALIRKEEDIVSTLGCEQHNISNVDDSRVDLPPALVNYNMLNENNTELDMGVKSVIIDGDQDVVMLINPTPTINLLSSDSETDNWDRCMREQLKGEQHEYVSRDQLMKCEQTKLITKTTDGSSQIAQGVNMNNHLCVNNEFEKKHSDASVSCVHRDIIKIEDQPNKQFVSADENKLVDEEIIDLDDYPDDMDDIENNEHISSRYCKEPINDINMKNKSPKFENIVSNSEETWATRYYQTDNVQNVMKESKIQSEIRKRLRERQKLSKLNICTENIRIGYLDNYNERVEPIHNPLKLTGSVQEYLALEGKKNGSRNNSLSEDNARPLDVDGDTS